MKEWWFKCSLRESEKKCERQKDPSPEVIEFYEGRLYQKEVKEETTHNDWIPIEQSDNEGN